jgi:hypothetical protein
MSSIQNKAQSPDRLESAYKRYCLLAISASTLPESSKRLMMLIARDGLEEFSYGQETVAKKLGLSVRTVRRAIRCLEDIGALTLIHEERFGRIPCVYRVNDFAEALKGGHQPGHEGGQNPGQNPGHQRFPDIVRPPCPGISNTSSGECRKDAQQPPANQTTSLADANRELQELAGMTSAQRAWVAEYERGEIALADSDMAEADEVIRAVMAGGI